MKTINILLLIISILPINCATIYTAGMQSVPVITKPENATVLLYDSKSKLIFNGNTPCIIYLKKKDIIGSRLIISKPGYEKIELIIGETIDVCFWGNICLCGFPAILDIMNGNWKRADVGGVIVHLNKLDIVYHYDGEEAIVLADTSSNTTYRCRFNNKNKEYTVINIAGVLP